MKEQRTAHAMELESTMRSWMGWDILSRINKEAEMAWETWGILEKTVWINMTTVLLAMHMHKGV